MLEQLVKRYYGLERAASRDLDRHMTDIRRLPGPQVEKWEWQLLGACRKEDTDLFFHPEGERGPSRSNREAAAKAVL